VKTESTDAGAVIAEGADERAFFLAFDAFTRAVRRARGAQPRSTGQSLTLSQYALLELLATQADARAAELAEEAGVTASTATRILDALERRGVVRRTRAPEDRRAVRITLTPEGRTMLKAQQGWVGERKRSFVRALSDEQRAVLPELMHALAALIDELAAGPESGGEV
jgi:DNA-binding MarR family transcriptional regulator